jgi:hypothetical protein
MKSILIKILALVIVTFTLFTSCEETNQNDYPELPPMESFVMDFSDFSGGTKSTSQDTVSFINYKYAEGTVWFWSFITAVTTYIPTFAFVESFNHEPTQISDFMWEWSYTVRTENNEYYTARLTGEILTDSLDWNMYLSKGDDFQDFHWYYGKSSISNTGGWWILNESPEVPEQVLRMYWSRTSTEEGTLRYTYVKPGDKDNGNYIEYREAKENDKFLNAAFDVVDLDEEQVNIEWNQRTKEGRVKKAGEDFWSCWDENKYDTSCN